MNSEKISYMIIVFPEVTVIFKDFIVHMLNAWYGPHTSLIRNPLTFMKFIIDPKTLKPFSRCSIENILSDNIDARYKSGITQQGGEVDRIHHRGCST